MIYSEKFELVKNYYIKGMWNESMVQNAVSKWITEQEAEEILATE